MQTGYTANEVMVTRPNTEHPPGWSVFPRAKNKVGTRSFGERLELAISREKRNAAINTALGN